MESCMRELTDYRMKRAEEMLDVSEVISESPVDREIRKYGVVIYE